MDLALRESLTRPARNDPSSLEESDSRKSCCYWCERAAVLFRDQFKCSETDLAMKQNRMNWKSWLYASFFVLNAIPNS